MYLPLNKYQEGQKVFHLRIWLEELPNRLAALERARLECTCEAYALKNLCRHVQQADTQFRRTLAAERRKLLRQVTQGQDAHAISRAVSAAVGQSIRDCQVFALPDGSYAVQKPKDICDRIQPPCGWGTAGREVVLIEDWPLVGMLHALKTSPDFPQVDPAVERQILLPLQPMALPPDVLSASCQDHTPPNSVKANGLIDLFTDGPDLQAEEWDEGTALGQFWAAVLGFQLDSDISGNGPYLPAYTITGRPAGAMALDLVRGRMKLIPDIELGALSAGIPRAYQHMIAHTHLPWGQDGQEAASYQVILCHPSRQRMVPDEPVLVLTTNLWLGPQSPWPEALLGLFAQTAALLLRMGHRKECLLHHGETGMQLADLAEAAAASPAGGATPADGNTWTLIKAEVIPAIRRGAPVSSEVIQRLDPDWGQLLLNIERKHNEKY